MLPLSLLSAAQNKPMLVELKNGETFNGHLVNCDNFMNITLREVYQTSADGDRFWKLKECYIRGSTIKYLRVPDTLLDTVKEEQTRAREAGRSARGAGPGARGMCCVLMGLLMQVSITDLLFLALCKWSGVVCYVLPTRLTRRTSLVFPCLFVLVFHPGGRGAPARGRGMARAALARGTRGRGRG